MRVGYKSSSERNGPDRLQTLLSECSRSLKMRMRMRAANATDPGWRQFYDTSATAYTQLVVEMQPLEAFQAHLDEKAAATRRQFSLDKRRKEVSTHDQG